MKQTVEAQDFEQRRAVRRLAESNAERAIGLSREGRGAEAIRAELLKAKPLTMPLNNREEN